jgi:hypothetical protein
MSQHLRQKRISFKSSNTQHSYTSYEAGIHPNATLGSTGDIYMHVTENDEESRNVFVKTTSGWKCVEGNNHFHHPGIGSAVVLDRLNNQWISSAGLRMRRYRQLGHVASQVQEETPENKGIGPFHTKKHLSESVFFLVEPIPRPPPNRGFSPSFDERECKLI